MRENKRNLIKYLSFLSLFILYTKGYAVLDQKGSQPIEHIYKVTESIQLKIYQFRPLNFDMKQRYPAVVVFHGGGWSIGEPEWGFPKAKHFAGLGMMAFSAQYRLIDKDKKITPLESMEDTRDVIRWMRVHAGKLNLDPDKIAAYGWSAGAHLAVSAAVFNQSDAKHKVSCAPNLLLLTSPALALTGDRWFNSILLGRANAKNVSPTGFIRKGLPPSIITIGETDTVTPLSGAKKYHDQMLKYGNESELIVYKNVGHLFTPSSEPDNGWPNPDKEISEKAANEIDRFLKRHHYIK